MRTGEKREKRGGWKTEEEKKRRAPACLFFFPCGPSKEKKKNWIAALSSRVVYHVSIKKTPHQHSLHDNNTIPHRLHS